MEVIELTRMAEALSCQPRTLCRLIHGPFGARSLQKGLVSLGLAAQSLKTDQVALSRFVSSALEKRDEALTAAQAIKLSGMKRSTFYRHVQEGTIPVVAQAGKFSRFSSEAIMATVYVY